ncbi:RipA family octameric membrane protein [Corallococcus macrosporus]|uniref:RipA family octameric membrane protein n=1 Tax=Corallococcus macrosporus TaxID=35 RepID=UPI00195B1E57|nr:hypothetical protein [Corallococcus macrosporus]
MAKRRRSSRSESSRSERPTKPLTKEQNHNTIQPNNKNTSNTSNTSNPTKNNSNASIKILAAPSEEYGAEYRSHLLDQYKMYIELMDKVSERRQHANTFFLTINTALIGLLGIAWPQGTPNSAIQWHVGVGLAGLSLCYSWNRLLRSYRGINQGKFDVIHAIEEYLPLRLFAAEWTALGEGKDKKKYLPFTAIEPWVPWVFFALHLGILVAASVQLYHSLAIFRLR